MLSVTADEPKKVLDPERQPRWRNNKPFGELTSNRSLNHYFVGVIEVNLGHDWKLTHSDPSDVRSIHHKDGRELKLDEEIRPDQIRDGMFAEAKRTDGRNCTLGLNIRRIEADENFADFVSRDQQIAFGHTIQTTGEPIWDRCVQHHQAWIANREATVIDIEGIYRKGGLKETYYYIPVTPSVQVAASNFASVSYVLVLQFFYRDMSMRDQLALAIPGMVKMLPPVLWNGDISQEQGDFGNRLRGILNSALQQTDMTLVDLNMAETPKREELFDIVGRYATEANQGSLDLGGRSNIRGAIAAGSAAWTDYLEVAERANTRYQQVHRELGLRAWKQMSDDDRADLKNFRLDLWTSLSDSDSNR